MTTGRGRTGEHAEAAIVAGHETFEQRSIKTVEVGERVGDGESGLEVHVQRAMAKGRQIDECGARMDGVQGDGEIDGGGGGAAAALGVNDGEDLAAVGFATRLAAG